jgi:hypothetical protein
MSCDPKEAQKVLKQLKVVYGMSDIVDSADYFEQDGKNGQE